MTPTGSSHDRTDVATDARDSRTASTWRDRTRLNRCWRLSSRASTPQRRPVPDDVSAAKPAPNAAEMRTIHKRMHPTGGPFEGCRRGGRGAGAQAIARHNAEAYAELRPVLRLQPCAASCRPWHLVLSTDHQPGDQGAGIGRKTSGSGSGSAAAQKTVTAAIRAVRRTEKTASTRAHRPPSPEWHTPKARSEAFMEYDNSKATRLLPQDCRGRRTGGKHSRRGHTDREVDFHSTLNRLWRNPERNFGTRQPEDRSELLILDPGGLSPYDEHAPGRVRQAVARRCTLPNNRRRVLG